MRSLIRALVPRQVKEVLRPLRVLLSDPHATKSYSQEGEDMILRRIFEHTRAGFYVDVGAHHPHRFSNTNFFYKRGWRGLNVEPNPDAVAIFRRFRKRDINLQCGISDQEGSITYYKFDEGALNTFDKAMADERLATTSYRLAEKIQIPVRRLANVLAEVVPAGQRIDFMSVDVEGLDLQVLQSNDWERYRPSIVLAEAIDTDLADVDANRIAAFMKRQGYIVLAKTFNTWIFKDQRTK